MRQTQALPQPTRLLLRKRQKRNPESQAPMVLGGGGVLREGRAREASLEKRLEE